MQNRWNVVFKTGWGGSARALEHAEHVEHQALSVGGWACGCSLCSILLKYHIVPFSCLKNKNQGAVFAWCCFSKIVFFHGTCGTSRNIKHLRVGTSSNTSRTSGTSLIPRFLGLHGARGTRHEALGRELSLF